MSYILSFPSQIEPLSCSSYELHLCQESLERRLFAGASQRRYVNENEGFCFPWAAAEDLRIGGVEVRHLLKILVSRNVKKSLAKFTGHCVSCLKPEL